MLTFVIADTDRLYDPERPNQIAIAYALKGYSLNCQTLHQMIDYVRSESDRRGVQILCEAFDGQWGNLVFKSRTDEPLTRIQFQKKCWQEFSRKPRLELLENIIGYCKISKYTLDQFASMLFIQCKWMDQSFTLGNLSVTSKL